MLPGQLVQRDSLAGLRDKLYWRPSASGTWHCFKRLDERDRRDDKRYISLCHDHYQARAGGQSCARPPVLRRCGRCDGHEITRRGADESLPESPNWRDHDL